MSDITAIVLTLNEEAYIAGCLESLKWCDQVLVLDSYSSDRTVDIARQYGVRVAKRCFTNFGEQRNAAIDLINTDWLFFVDADERVTPELAREVKLAIQDAEYDGWWVPRNNIFFGKLLEHGGFYPDYHLRLAKTSKYRYNSQQKVHEQPDLDGKTGYLHHPLVHFWYQSFREMLETRSKYATLMAQIHYERGIHPTYHLLVAPVYVFFKQLFKLNSYKDGTVGFLISAIWGYYKFVEYWRVWRISRAAGKQTAVEKKLDLS